VNSVESASGKTCAAVYDEIHGRRSGSHLVIRSEPVNQQFADCFIFAGDFRFSPI